jgi:hypothetical protein
MHNVTVAQTIPKPPEVVAKAIVAENAGYSLLSRQPRAKSGEIVFHYGDRDGGSGGSIVLRASGQGGTRVTYKAVGVALLNNSEPSAGEFYQGVDKWFDAIRALAGDPQVERSQGL